MYKLQLQMKQSLLMFFLFAAMNLQGQVLYSPEMPEMIGDSDSHDIITEIQIINDKGEQQDIYWDIETVEVDPSWRFQMCDKNLCYLWGILTCPDDRPSDFAATDTANFMLHIDPRGAAGTGSLIVHIMSPFDNVIASIPVEINISLTSSVDNLDEADLNIYPNPASDMFQIKNDEEIGKVTFFNIVGKKLSSYNHYSGKTYDVSHLNKGIYLVRLFDNNDNVLKVVRLNKS